MYKVLVTGATGFIGKRLINELLKHFSAKEILCLAYMNSDSDLEINGREFLKKKNIDCKFIDLISGQGLEDLPKTFEKVYHLASITDTGSYDHSVNDKGTRNLIEALGSDLKNKHFIFTSTIAITDIRDNYDIPVTENTPPNAKVGNEYGRRKLLAVNYLKEAASRIGFKLSIVRVSGIYGDDTRSGGLFTMVDTFAKKNSLIGRVNFQGKIGIMFVEDMAKLITKASFLKLQNAQVIEYIGATESLSFQEMIKIAYSSQKKEYKEIKIPNFIWAIVRFIARNKATVENLMPHKLYNRFWQLFILVNHEFWNEPGNLSEVIDWKITTFSSYYRNRYN